MTAAELRKLASIGLTGEQIAAVAEILAGREESRAKSTDRVRAFRQRRMERDETPMKRDETFHETHSPPPSPPPLPPLQPPLPAPTPAPPPPTAPAHTREATAKLPTKAQQRELDIRQADEEPLPLDLNTPSFRDLWADWCLHRAELYRREPRKRWSRQAARNTLLDCSRHGPEIAGMAIRAAIANGWQGLVWGRLAPAPITNGRARLEPAPHAPDKTTKYGF